MHIELKRNRITCALIVLSLLGFSAIVIGQHLAGFTNLTDIEGMPSQVAIGRGGSEVTGSTRRYHRRFKSRLAAGDRQRGKTNIQVAGLPPKPVAQNVNLFFVDEKYHRPVKSLPVEFIIVKKGGHTTRNFVTDASGCVKLSHISPLPAAINIFVRSSTIGATGEPEWELSNPQMASILVKNRTGAKIATIKSPPGPYQVASTSYMLPRRTGRSSTMVVYQFSQDIALKRNAVDFQAYLPSNAQVSYPTPDAGRPSNLSAVGIDSAPSQGDETQVSVSWSGSTAHFTLPASILADGPVPLRICQTTNSGVLETVVSKYTSDPYSTNQISPGALSLAAIKDIEMPNNIDVLSRASDVEALFPDIDKHAHASGDDRSQGSDWWKSDYPAVSFRIRKSPFSNDDAQGLVECIRLDKADAGSVAGIRVGMPKQDLINTLGDGIETYDSISYLDGGVTFAFDGDTVKSIYVDRPRELLEQGTTAFVPRKPAKVFVKSFHVDGRWSGGMAISNLDELKSYLVRTGVVQLVDNEQDADYTLTCEASNFIEKKDVPLGVIPLQYECGMTLTYTLKDNATGQIVYSDRSVNADENVDFWKLLLPILTGVAVVNKVSHNNTANVIADALGVAFIAALKDAADKADKACPRLVEQEAYGRMADDLYDAFDCRCRVTAIDYSRGTLTMNSGTADGVVAGGDNRTTFEILVNTDKGPTPLPSSEGGMSADYYVAEVLSAGDHTCTCVLEHVTHSVKIRYGLFGKSYVADNTNVKNDIDMLRRIPDSATGIVSARIKSRLLPLPIPPTN